MTDAVSMPALDALEASSKTERMGRFARAYVANGGNGSAAAREVAPTLTPKAAGQLAHRNLADARVREAIRELRAATAEAVGMTAEKVISIQAAIATFRITDIARVRNGKLEIIDSDLWPEHARHAVKRVAKGSHGLSVWLEDRQPALEFFARHLDMPEAIQKLQVSGPDGGPVEHEHRAAPEFADVISAFRVGARASDDDDGGGEDGEDEEE